MAVYFQKDWSLKSLQSRSVFKFSAVHRTFCLTSTIAAAAVLSACGGGAVFIGDGVGLRVHASPPNDGREVLTAVFVEPAGRNCARGGTRIDAGIDANRNKVLDEQEITSTRYVCNA